MDLIEKATIMHYHRHRVEQYRHGTAESLGWRSADNQKKRFEALADVGDLGGASVLDVGCGYGDLKACLDLRYTDVDYIGIDQQPEFVREARARYAGYPRTQFFQTDFTTAELPQMDYVLASGALGYRSNTSNYYADMIHKLYCIAKIAVAFNMLDKARFPRHDLLIGHDRDKILAYCRTLSSHVVMRNDYLADDFTVFMYR
ncbi:Methyltransferase domain-containing protein [Nitrosomonas sp. Nm51]|uniref:class I SAM-dependent methyltransferase n=1 Tax=Nitrosomonas sp. Nm51 TaxID=133720 RepID=UPI0008B40D6F|nr:class I SAM-dependent methyltransferase [Nitrosomonas sp. Nm51]SEQ98847.1 Methyltransferase domain-containing protein [Nitrosomonas sp. Nm51]